MQKRKAVQVPGRQVGRPRKRCKEDTVSAPDDQVSPGGQKVDMSSIYGSSDASRKNDTRPPLVRSITSFFSSNQELNIKLKSKNISNFSTSRNTKSDVLTPCDKSIIKAKLISMKEKVKVERLTAKTSLYKGFELSKQHQNSTSNRNTDSTVEVTQTEEDLPGQQFK